MLACLLLALAAVPVDGAHGLSGWLVDPDGVRIEGAVLLFEPLDGQPPARFAADPTDAAGAWTLEGLAPGRWRPSLRHFGPSLGEVRFEPQELVVPSLPVRLEAAVVHVTLVTELRGGWFCMQLPGRSPSGDLEGGEVLWPMKRLSPLLFRPGARAVVGSWSNRRGLVEREFELPAEGGRWGWRVPIPELPPESPRGTVEVRVPRLSTTGRLGLSVLAPRSRFELERHGTDGIDPRGWRFDLRLPPGQYVLRIGDSEMRGGCGMDQGWDRHVARPIEVPIAVDARSHQQLDLAWPVSLRPKLAFDAPDALEVFVWELDARGAPVRPVAWEPLSASTPALRDHTWVPGRAHFTREPLPVGRVRLLAGAEGFAPREFELDLVDGVPFQARIELLPLGLPAGPSAVDDP